MISEEVADFSVRHFFILRRLAESFFVLNATFLFAIFRSAQTPRHKCARPK
jgi:hypothetical protein